MSVPNRQIGQSAEANLLWNISKQLDVLKKYASISDPALIAKIDELISATSQIEISAESINLNTDQLESLVEAGNLLLEEIKTNTAASFDGQLIQDGNPVSDLNPLPVSATLSLSEYYVEDVEEDTATNTTYVGKQTDAGIWLVQKIVETTVGTITTTTIQYATILNNATVLTYSDAWTNRASLTYSEIKDLI